jgi:hypothetical protein
MTSPFFSGRIPQELYDRIDQCVKETGQNKTQIMINALSAYLGVEISRPTNSNFVSELEQIKERLTVLEESARSTRTVSQLSLLDVKPDNSDNTKLKVVGTDNINNKTEVLSTSRVTELTGIHRKTLEDRRKKNQFPIEAGKYIVVSFVGKQTEKPFANLWEVITD